MEESCEDPGSQWVLSMSGSNELDSEQYCLLVSIVAYNSPENTRGFYRFFYEYPMASPHGTIEVLVKGGEEKAKELLDTVRKLDVQDEFKSWIMSSSYHFVDNELGGEDHQIWSYIN